MVFTIIFDCFLIAIWLYFILNSVIQLNSFIKLIKFITKRTFWRTALYILSLTQTLLYIFTFQVTVFYFWGLPAFWMTTESNDGQEYVNSNRFCILDLENYDQNMAIYTNIVFICNWLVSVARVTRFLWTLMLFGGMIYF